MKYQQQVEIIKASIKINAGVSDYAENQDLLTDNVFVDELPDIETPRLESASINYGTGVIIIQCSETIDTLQIR